jgi:hypothetical protein
MKTSLTENLSSDNQIPLVKRFLENFRTFCKKPENKPPRAPLVLRIGVTGHRTEPEEMPEEKRKRSVPNIQAINLTIIEVLEVIRVSFKGIADTKGDLFDLSDTRFLQRGGGTLRIISALASGADQWVAKEALKLGFELQTILPFEREEYLKDFTVQSDAASYLELLDKATSIVELDGKVDFDVNGVRKPDSQSYEAVGRAVLNQTDLLIAIWDGEDSHGRGGTGQIVREALQNGIPVVWIPWSSPGKWQIKTLTWRLLEEPADITGESDRLSEMIGNLLLPPEENHQTNHQSDKSLRTEYFNEGQKSGNPHLGIWALFQNLICIGLFKKKFWKKVAKPFFVKDFYLDEESKVQDFWNKTADKENFEYPFHEEIQQWVNKRYSKHYAWANGLSVFYGDMHRSSFVVNYLLGASAVFLALACIAFSLSGRYQTGLIIAELAVIVGILYHTHRGRRRRWHQRWIDYRTLAEYLRLSRCLILFGGGSPQHVYDGHLRTYGNPSSTWMYWHYRAIERAAGLPNTKFDENYLTSCQEIWRDGLIKNQINYHTSAFDKFQKINTRLHVAGDLLFKATFVACLIHLAHLWLEPDIRFDWIPENAGDWMTVLCAFLPALGAAFTAIRSHSEAQRLAQRSKAMEESLTEIQTDFAKIPVTGKSFNSIKLRNHANRVNDLMTNEMLDWRVVFQDRPLNLPA